MTPFTPKDWRNNPDTSTPLSAVAIEDMETRLSGYTNSELVTHTADSTAVHGITDTAQLSLKSELSAHEADTTAIHGITDTAQLALKTSGGKLNIATEETHTSGTAYGLLPTPDHVQNVVLPTNGLLIVGYQALWKNTVASAGRGTIFIGANQIKMADAGNTAPLVREATGNSTINNYHTVNTSPDGLTATATSAVYTGDVTTGMLLGGDPVAGAAGLAYIWAAAGTYDVSIQFKATSGTVTVKERRLWVWVENPGA